MLRRRAGRSGDRPSHHLAASVKHAEKVLHITSLDAHAACRDLHMRRCHVHYTKGDGACAIHSVFGAIHRGEFEKVNARSFLRDSFGVDADTFSARVADAAIVTQLGQVLWQELVQPCAAEAVGLDCSRLIAQPESNTVWAEILRNSPALALQCVDAARSEHQRYELFSAARADIVNEFAKLCVRTLEHTFVRPLLGYLGMLEEYEQGFTEVPGYVVEVSKLDALFVEGAHRKKLLQGVVERCGVDNFDILFEKVSDLVGGMELGEETECIFKFGQSLNEAQDSRFIRSSEPFPHFFQQIYPSYLDALCSSTYYLSDVELLALCRCTQTNIAIFQHDTVSGSLTYLRGAVVDDAAPLMITSIQANPDQVSVRTHFEKLTTAKLPNSPAALPPRSGGSGSKAGSIGSASPRAPPIVGEAGLSAHKKSDTERPAKAQRTWTQSQPDVNDSSVDAEADSVASAEALAARAAACSSVLGDSAEPSIQEDDEAGYIAYLAACAGSIHEGDEASYTAYLAACAVIDTDDALYASYRSEQLRASIEGELADVELQRGAQRNKQGGVVDAEVELLTSAEAPDACDTACSPSKSSGQHRPRRGASADHACSSTPVAQKVAPGAAQPEAPSSAARESEPHGGRPPQQSRDAARIRRKRAEMLSMFHIRTKGDVANTTVYDQQHHAARAIAGYLRDHPTMPADPEDPEKTEPFTDVDGGGRLPPVSCAVQGCAWWGGHPICRAELADDPEHPWDRELRAHVTVDHQDLLESIAVDVLGDLADHASRAFAVAADDTDEELVKKLLWHLFKEAIAVKEREAIPIVGPSVDRRSFDHLAQVYTDATIRQLICFCCAQSKTDTGCCRSEIAFRSCKWLLRLGAKTLQKNFSFQEFSARYRKADTALCHNPPESEQEFAVSPDFTDWLLRFNPDAIRQHSHQEQLSEAETQALLLFGNILCCPEDVVCRRDSFTGSELCLGCEFPVCRSCMVMLCQNEVVPAGLCNDNWIGYIHKWIMEKKVTWMEKTVVTPFWTGFTLYTLPFDAEYKGRRLHDPAASLYESKARIASRGQVWSAALDWDSVREQLEGFDNREAPASLPHTGEVLSAIVKVRVTHGLIDFSKYLKDATVRRQIVIDLVRMLKASGDEDYADQDLEVVKGRAYELAKTDDPSIPDGIMDMLVEQRLDEDGKLADLSTDKAATPAERPRNAAELAEHMAQLRPNILFVQRDSDALKNVEASRKVAMDEQVCPELHVQVGSKLIDQFQGGYIPRVFKLTFPWRVGGPDLYNRSRLRRSPDAPAVSLDMYTAMLARRVEGQLRMDQHLLPAVWSLCFATKVNTFSNIAMQKNMAPGRYEDGDETNIGKHTQAIYHMLHKGNYTDSDGKQKPIAGDLSKLLQATNITQQQKSLLQSYHFMSARLPGTRQLRRGINHRLFSAQVFYGLPIFMTVTPSDRHSGLMLRLSRYRRNDPIVTTCVARGEPDIQPWAGFGTPSLENVDIPLPSYRARKLWINRDPLCSVDAFKVMIRRVLAQLYGLRMCPECPNCACSGMPCTDLFGSNATPMGGSLGRADALIGAVEAQKAEGVLHLHFFLFVQMAHQFKTLQEIGDMFRQGILEMKAFKKYHNHARCAEYPDVKSFEAERASVEATWPEYKQDTSMCRPPEHLWSDARVPHTNHLLDGQQQLDAWKDEGMRWTEVNQDRLQHILSRMNHHIHPLQADGQRRPLKSCQPQKRPTECKGGFPLENEMTNEALLVCPCVAAARALPLSGPRGRTGTILPCRNHAWLNAGPRAWLIVAGANGDVKLPMRVPIMKETHEVLFYDVRRCYGPENALDLAYEVQVGQSVTAGYFGGYSAKMQLVGKKEVQQLEDAISRKISYPTRETPAKQFQSYTRRLVRDLDGQGIIRTGVETTNLMVNVDAHDVWKAECIRTFATVHFPASELLAREEVEAGNRKGKQLIKALQGRGIAGNRRAYVDAPFDIMYGFRSSDGCGLCEEVLHLTAYEMIMHWELVVVPPPASYHALSELTAAGEAYSQECKQRCQRPKFRAGDHYTVVPGEHRILMPENECLGVLRHRWMWQRRRCLHVPVWSRAKVPRATFSPHENARLLSIYLRPWTIDPTTTNESVPLLSDLSLVKRQVERQAEAAPVRPQQRLRSKSTCPDVTRTEIGVLAEERSYSRSWQEYVNGNVVSETSARYIRKMLDATAARTAATEDASSGDESSAESDLDLFREHAGNVTLVEKTLRGIAARDTDEGTIGAGRHAASVCLGNELWGSANLTEAERKRAREHVFKQGHFPNSRDALKAAEKLTVANDKRMAPFAEKTMPYAHLSLTEYGSRIDAFLRKLPMEDEPPTAEQQAILERVARRVLREFRERHSPPEVESEVAAGTSPEAPEEPMLALVHGHPGTGKSKVLRWLRRLFTEALGWRHGEQFLCVAFQNRMAAAIGGKTIHSGGNFRPAGANDSSLAHSDIDHLFMRNESLRWILLDEISMVSDDLLGQFEDCTSNAARESRYLRHPHTQKRRLFGGYNVMVFGDWWQLPPIPDTGALFKPPIAPCSGRAKAARNMFWGEGDNTINYMAELTEQKRLDDPWYNDVMVSCRSGAMDDESYHFFTGLPTQHCGSWHRGQALCGSDKCSKLSSEWATMAKRGESWEDMVTMECGACRQERNRRCRVVVPGDPRIKRPPFVDAPFIHQNNEPKYHALLKRAVEHAKRGGEAPKHILWVVARDKPHNPAEIDGTPDQVERKRASWLQFHDQKTAGIPGLFPLYIGMKARVTDKISNTDEVSILKHTSCTVVGWDLDPKDTGDSTNVGERMLSELPRCIYVKFDPAIWQVMQSLEIGVFPLKPVRRTWVLNKKTEVKVTRQGFTLLPDFACTAHMVQGMTCDAVIADCGSLSDAATVKDMLAAYVALTRVRTAHTLLLLRIFSRCLFQQGPPPGPHCLMKRLRAKLNTNTTPQSYSVEDAIDEYTALSSERRDTRDTLHSQREVWKCFVCNNTFPSTTFDIDVSAAKGEELGCTTKGHWLMCKACAATHLPSSSSASSTTCALRVCKACNEEKPEANFALNVGIPCWCRHCEQGRELKHATCHKCSASLSWLEFSRPVLETWLHGGSPDELLCIDCCGVDLECTVCRTQQARHEFHESAIARHKRSGILRCRGCYRCKICNEVKTDARQFVTNSNVCCKCNGRSNITKLKCLVCRMDHLPSAFPAAQLKNFMAGQNLVTRCIACHICKGCGEKKDAKQFAGGGDTCKACVALKEAQLLCSVCKKLKVAGAFSAGQRKHWTDVQNQVLRCEDCHFCKGCGEKKDAKQFAGGGDTCKACVALKEAQLPCSVCKTLKEAGAFSAGQRKNWASGQNQVLRCEGCHYCKGCGEKKDAKQFAGGGETCKACSALTAMLVCAACGKPKEAAAFTPSQRHNAKQRPNSLCCVECQGRETRVKKKLRARGAWKCTCGKPLHSEKCQLFPTAAGESRWEGKNVGVTKDDVNFLKRRRTG